MARPCAALAALLLALACATVAGRDLLQTGSISNAADGDAAVLPVVPPLAPASASAGNDDDDWRGLAHNVMTFTLADMPADAAANASVALGYLFAPLLLRRGPLGARGR